MSGPTISEVHINRPLTNMMISYAQTQDIWIADKVFPICPVLKKSDKFFKVEKGAWFRAGAVERAPGTESVGINYHITTGDYTCKVFAVHYDLDAQTRANYDTPLAAEQSAMRFVTRNLMNTRELQFIQTYMQPGIWSGANATGATTNSDYDVIAHGHGAWNSDAGDPLADIIALRTYVEGRTSYTMNKLTLAPDVYSALCTNKSLLDKIKFTQRGVLTKDLLASLFGVDEILIAKLPINQSPVARQDNTNFALSNCFLFSYAPSAPSIQEPSAGYNFAWTGYLGAGAYGNVMTQFPMPWLKSDRFEGEMAYGMYPVATDVAVFGVNVLAH